jgi:beta-aspartyl-peptidase (threonine type)
MVIDRRWIGICGLVSAGLASAVWAEDPSDREDPVRAVRAVLERQVADWNRGDLDAFLGGYWTSPKVVFQTGGQRIEGWEAMRRRYHQRYRAEGRAMGRLEFSALEIEPLGPEAVLARGRWRLTMPDGTRPGGLFTVIFRRLPEGWKIVHDHTSAEDARPAEARPAAEPRRD